MLVRNIDFNYDVPLHWELRRQLASGKIDLSQVQSVVIREFSDPTELEKLAESGNAEAQYRLGETLYRKGNRKDAIPWLEKAANQDNFYAKARILTDICFWYKQSESLENPYLSTFQEKASKDDADSIILLGVFYHSACGVKRDFKKALSFYKKAEKFDTGYTNMMMGGIYRAGGGELKKICGKHLNITKSQPSMEMLSLKIIWRGFIEKVKALRKI